MSAKQKIVQGRGPSNAKLILASLLPFMIFLASGITIPSINYAKICIGIDQRDCTHSS